MKSHVKHSVLIMSIGLLVLMSNALLAEVTLAGLFGDNMVLQYGQEVPIWGWADPGEKVTVKFAGQTKSAVTTPDGKWILMLEPMKINAESQSMTFFSDRKNAPLTINNILVGDVWLCSGQSNMEVGIGSTLNAKEEIKNADYPLIRHVKIEKSYASSPQEDVVGRWRLSKPSNTHYYFSAVGYYFAREVFQGTKVPIGLINASWGSTRVEPWIGPLSFRSALDLDEAVSEDKEKPKNPYEARQAPGVLYNAMIHPLLPYAIRGVLWYQGESNASADARQEYRQKLTALIQGWRQSWGRTDLPFYFVQLAGYGDVRDDPSVGGGWAVIREAQRQCLKIDHTGMAVTIDIGDAKNIHPRNKQDVGKRLAQWILHDMYGKQLVPSGPLYKNHTISGKKIIISFDHVGKGLMVGSKQDLNPTVKDENSELQRFAIAGEDQKWRWANAVIKGDTVEVSHPEVKNPVAVRYAYSMNPEGANLYNADGLPASPFTTEQTIKE